MLTNISKNTHLSCCLLVALTSNVSTLHAEIYKCTNFSNEVYYNDKPCQLDELEDELKAEKDVKGRDAFTEISNLRKKDDSQNRRIITEKNLKSKSELRTHKASDSEVVSLENDGIPNSTSGYSTTESNNDNDISSVESTTSRIDESSIKGNRELSEFEKEALFINMHAGQTLEEREYPGN